MVAKQTEKTIYKTVDR